jgi:hypothetical protein
VRFDVVDRGEPMDLRVSLVTADRGGERGVEAGGVPGSRAEKNIPDGCVPGIRAVHARASSVVEDADDDVLDLRR